MHEMQTYFEMTSTKFTIQSFGYDETGYIFEMTVQYSLRYWTVKLP